MSDEPEIIPPNAEYVPDEEAADELILDEQPYQVMNALDADAYSQLKEGIRENGILDPIHVTPQGYIIDGHHRVVAWREIERDGDGLDAGQTPAFVIHSRTEEAARHATVRDEDGRQKGANTFRKAGGSATGDGDVQYFKKKAWELNMQQRHLNDGEKKEAIERRLQQLDAEGRRKPDYAVAETLGVSGSWVREVRHRLEGSGNIRTAADITTVTGGRRTQEDTTEKRSAVEEAIRSDPGRSNREIAREVGVSHPFVGGVRDELAVPDVPQWWTQTAHADDFWQYVVHPDGWDVTAFFSVEPEGWTIWLRGREFYESRDLLGRGLNEGWVVARARAESAVRAAEITGVFARNPTVYAERKADELRNEGYEFEYQPMPHNTDEGEV